MITSDALSDSGKTLFPLSTFFEDNMKVVVIGGGPAGMMASIAAAQSGDEVVLLEKNEK